ncbi:MAG: hypothetical protein HC794_09690 [Nitrospiraceae bacterium]|nr:hypothetical protein [Nitrospiraceae bacterium]
MRATETELGERYLYCDGPASLVFTENETNTQRLWGAPNASPYVKDGINDAVVYGQRDRVNPNGVGSKVAAHFQAVIPPGETMVVQARFTNRALEQPFADFAGIVAQRTREADEFYTVIQNPDLDDDERQVQRQAFAGLLWSKQYYHYSLQLWLNGDPAGPPPPAARRHGRNHRAHRQGTPGAGLPANSRTRHQSSDSCAFSRIRDLRSSDTTVRAHQTSSSASGARGNCRTR